MTTFSDAVRALASDAVIDRADVQRWIDSGDLLTWSAVYALLTDSPARVHPEVPHDQQIELARHYLVRCIAENPNPGETLHGGYEAAWELAATLKLWRRRGGRATGALRRVAVDLAALFRKGDAATQNRILCGVLEHAFEDPGVRTYFKSWQRELDLREIYNMAVEWGAAHEDE